MRNDGTGRYDRARVTLVAAVATVAIVICFGVWQLVKPKDLQITAQFPRAVGLYEGDDVRVLGIAVGRIDKVERDGSAIEVTMTVKPDVDVPRNASAVMIAPSLVSGRYIQLTPAYRSGPKMPQDGVIPKARTAVPVEFDELKGALNRFGKDLGPDGAKDGSGPLARAVDTAAKNLDGNGQNMHDTLHELSAAVSTLADSRGDIFLTVRNLAEFTEVLAESDAEMRSFTTNMAQLTGDFADNREELSQTLDKLNRVVPQLQDFVRDNRPLLRESTGKLETLTEMLSQNRQGLADLLQVAPVAMANTYNIYDPKYYGQVGALVLPFEGTPADIVCWLMAKAGAASAKQCKAVKPVLDQLTKVAGAGQTVNGGLGSLMSGGAR
jgi:phospholipid/cholesterol/gamma-HCH transport system substrate-binding protein